jgi:outer membrane protein assembly factor BamB
MNWGDAMFKRFITVVLVAGISALGLASCDWSQFRLVASHSGDNATETAIGVGNVSTLRVDYTAAVSATTSSPAVAAGVVYIGSVDKKLYAFDAAGNTNCSGSPKTCAPLWTAATGGEIDSSPAVVNGTVYVSSTDGILYAFDAAGNTSCSGAPKTCAPLWTAPTGSFIASSPAVIGGVVYVGSATHNLYAFDAAGNTNCSGMPKVCAPLWTGPTGDIIASSPAVANGLVYVGSDDGSLYVFDATGTTNCSGVPKVCHALWTYNSGGSVVSSPAVVNGVVYAGDAFAQVSAFDAAGNTNCSGTPKVCQPLWATNLNSQQGIFSSPAVAHGTVYIGDQCNLTGHFLQPLCNNPPYFFALNAASGAVRWTAINTSHPILSSPGVANGLVFVGSDDGNLYAFDAAGSLGCSGTPTSCSPLWSGPTGGAVQSSPAIANGKVYVASGDGKLYAFGLP